MDIFHTRMTGGITRTGEFERKRLASFAVNVGTKCGHDCLYCSTGAMLRMHRSFKEAGQTPFGHGYAIVDPSTPDRVAADARRIRRRGMVQLCTVVDAWAPEAQEYHLGRKCLEAILKEPDWTVRILTKNAAVAEDFDLLEKHQDRVLVGLSITGTADKGGVLGVVEPHASPVEQRMAALQAHGRGLRTYGMLCPLLPGIADSPEQVDQLVQFVAQCGAEEVFVEPVNARGAALRLTEEALRTSGFGTEANAVAKIRRREHWSAYVTQLLSSVQQSVRQHMDLGRLRFLLYPARLLPEHLDRIRRDDAGVIWLGKD